MGRSTWGSAVRVVSSILLPFYLWNDKMVRWTKSIHWSLKSWCQLLRIPLTIKLALSCAPNAPRIRQNLSEGSWKRLYLLGKHAHACEQALQGWSLGRALQRYGRLIHQQGWGARSSFGQKWQDPWGTLFWAAKRNGWYDKIGVSIVDMGCASQ